MASIELDTRLPILTLDFWSEQTGDLKSMYCSAHMKYHALHTDDAYDDYDEKGDVHDDVHDDDDDNMMTVMCMIMIITPPVTSPFLSPAATLSVRAVCPTTPVGNASLVVI